MRPKHTPGPWAVAEHSNVIRGNCSRLILNVTGPFKAPVAQLKGAESRANARLIAAAPEMLELLCSCLIAIENGFDVEEERDPFIKMIRAAIAKAEGRDE